jgi:hypothetical protein
VILLMSTSWAGFTGVSTSTWLFFFFFSFGGVIGVWTQDFALAKQVLYHLSHAPAISALIILSWLA